ncbi:MULTISPECIES: hypothetical protein [unclassified Candidatus Tisiphia]|uniref:hypothetical protein n=1 Tax=unclassified Candidatus Tisiphia TaxID=2996318 RepID=UPI003CCB48C8
MRFINNTNILSTLGLVGTMVRDNLAAPFTTTDVISVNNRTEEETSTELVALKVAAIVAAVLALGAACGVASFACSYLRDKGCYDSKDDPLESLPDCDKGAIIQKFLHNPKGCGEENEQNDPERLSISIVDLHHVHDDDNDDNLSSISAARYALPDIVSHTIPNLTSDSDEESLISTILTNEEVVMIGDIQ